MERVCKFIETLEDKKGQLDLLFNIHAQFSTNNIQIIIDSYYYNNGKISLSSQISDEKEQTIVRERIREFCLEYLNQEIERLENEISGLENLEMEFTKKIIMEEINSETDKKSII